MLNTEGFWAQTQNTWPGQSSLHALSPTFRTTPSQEGYKVFAGQTAQEPQCFCGQWPLKVASSQKQPWKMSIILFRNKGLEPSQILLHRGFENTPQTRMTFSQKVAYSRADTKRDILGKEHFTSEYDYICTNSTYTISLLRSEEYSMQCPKTKSTLRYTLHH